MNAGTTNGPGQNDATDSAAIGVGGVTSGQEGATPSHETQQETGGNGGEQLTASQGNGEEAAVAEARDAAAQQDGTPAAAPGAAPNPAEPDETSMHSGARGAFDTRSGQAGGTGTGIGSPESGANQSPEDLAPPAGETNPVPPGGHKA
ncbi:hypothetical protein LK540_03485 [Massilia sp. IC2-278]|uniref:hypothetical protein n=1 Tax=Massilia sp. IC2-278 TaxID=2887200 RepID=UPI001E522FB9|nr:hypothetical protein [Massilia sp. IC2-278]MCC2959488.1 hypothetical protein [Massilia sp. IC2-278]